MKNLMEKPILYRARFLLPISAPPFENGALLVTGGHIVAVDTFHNLSTAYPEAAVVDFGDSALLPPMVNAHTHLELSSFADWAASAAEPAAPQNFVDWILWLLRVRRSVTAEQLDKSLANGLRASLLAGTGAVGDIFTGLGSVSAYQHSPLRGRVFAEVLGRDPRAVAERLAVIARFIEHVPGPDLDWGLSPHAPYTLSSAATDQVFAFADRQALQCAIHLAESADETAFLQDGSGAIAERLYAAANWNSAVDTAPGCSPVKAFCRQGRLRQGDLVVHGVQVAAAEVDLLKQTGCCVALCPRSNAALNVGKAPLAAYLKAGVALALGTDSLASSASLSVWDELAFARNWFAGEAAPRDWLEIATLGGARALGLHDRMGQLAPGFEASFQVVALPEMPCINELEEALCAAGADIEITHLYLASQNVLPAS
ncbi:MAG: amidohydrolase family protein [Desulfuromonadales bacterium]|nr:amidohydrolase family protein [Desulfuromonadales bacterium]